MKTKFDLKSAGIGLVAGLLLFWLAGQQYVYERYGNHSNDRPTHDPTAVAALTTRLKWRWI